MSHPERRAGSVEFLGLGHWATVPPPGSQQSPSWWRTESSSARHVPCPRRSLRHQSKLAVIRVGGGHRAPPALVLIRAEHSCRCRRGGHACCIPGWG